MLIASNFLLWIVVALLGIAVLAFARQMGVVQERIARLATHAGPPHAGDPVPSIHLVTLDGQSLAIGAGQPGARAMLLLFVSPACAVCRRLVPAAQAIAARDALDLVFLGDGDEDLLRQMASRYRIDDERFAAAGPARALHEGRFPHAVSIRANGTIAASATVGTREALEALLAGDRAAPAYRDAAHAA